MTGRSRAGRPALPTALVALGVAASVACTVGTTSDLWLDEAMSVDIARLPLTEIPGALEVDGAPPLYYVLLHVWTGVFGSGDAAVRSLSAVCALAALPLAWAAGRRVAGPAGARAALLLVASSPFTIRYATEARMYALVLALVLAGWLALQRARERPSWGRLAVVAGVAGLLVLTHYWSLYLLTVTAVVLAVVARREGGSRRAPARALGALVAGAAVALAAWSPVLLYQLGHTGTPWGEPGSPAHEIVVTVGALGGGQRDEHLVVGACVVALAVLGLLGRAVDGRRVELDLRTRPGVRAEAGVGAATGALGLLAGLVTGAAYQPRYAAVVVPLLLLAAAAGVAAFADPRVRAGVLAVVVVGGLVAGGAWNAVTDRTQGGDVARAIVDLGAPGDVVAYCPDQLGPATHRVLGDGFVEVAYPGRADGVVSRVDWVDYGDRIAAVDPVAFAAGLLERAGPDHVVWFVSYPGYRLFGDRCDAIARALDAARPDRLPIVAGSDVYEPMQLTRYAPP